eukprot:8754162-Pyramimonas_sp.AAC.1
MTDRRAEPNARLARGMRQGVTAEPVSHRSRWIRRGPARHARETRRDVTAEPPHQAREMRLGATTATSTTTLSSTPAAAQVSTTTATTASTRITTTTTTSGTIPGASRYLGETGVGTQPHLTSPAGVGIGTRPPKDLVGSGVGAQTIQTPQTTGVGTQTEHNSESGVGTRRNIIHYFCRPPSDDQFCGAVLH